MRLLRPRSLAALVLLVASPAVAQQEVGTAGAVNPAASGTPPSRATRVLELGSRVVHRERVNTTAGGTVQLIFLDKTTMSIGPNSNVVIDEFVYDPNAGTGRIAASMTKGVLRFVGGNTSHSGGAVIKTPSATLGIRGGVATIEVNPCGPREQPVASASCGTKVTNHFGILSVTSAAGTEVIRRPGFVVSIPSAAAAPAAPRRVTQAEVNQTNKSLASKLGQTGGTGGRVTPQVVARFDVIAPVIAAVGTDVASVQSQTQARQQSGAQSLGLTVAPNDATSPTQIQVAAANVSQQVTAQNSQSAAAEGNSQNGGITPVVPSSPQAFALAYPGGVPSFLPPGIVIPGSSYNSPVLGYADGGTTQTGAGATTSRVLQAGLSITGQGASQTSGLYVLAGRTFVTSGGTPAFSGGFTGTALVGSESSGVTSATLPGRASGAAVGSGSSVLAGPNGVPTVIRFRPGAIDDAGTITSQTATVVTYPGQHVVNYNYSGGAVATAAPSGLGTNRPDLSSVPNPNFGGKIGGLVTTVNNTTGAVVPTSALSGLLDLVFRPGTSQFGTTLGINANGANSGNPDALQSAYIDYGKAVDSFYSRPEAVDGRGTYVDYNNFGARESRSASDNSFTSQVNGSAVTEARGAFVTSDTVNAKSFFPNVAFCQCEFTRWGFWSSETSRTSSTGQSLTDLVHLGTWVSGDPTLAVDIPSTGTATYNGHAIASIQNGASQYVAAGNFQNVVNFGTGAGAATVSGLDGRNYAGTLSVGSGYNGISGTLATTSGAAATMSLNGLFNRGAAGPVGEMGGGLTINGTNYLGSGIFAASTTGIH